MKGYIAIVTGAGGGGSGRAIARRFARSGVRVVVADVDIAGGLETVRLIEAAGGAAVFFRADIGHERDIRQLVDFAENNLGGLDFFVNNASHPYHPEDRFGHWMETMQVDLIGPMLATLACLGPMRRRGGGAIVNVSSVSALGHGQKHAEVPAFDVAKAGLVRLTTTLGFLAFRDNIRVNCLAPGWIASPEVRAYVDSLDAVERDARGVPRTLLSVDQVAGAVFELATNPDLAGRIMVWWNDQPRRLIPAGDQGYEMLEPTSVAD